MTYVIFKLQLIKGKCIIFVGDVDRCYRLKLFLEQFGIRSCVLNSELPVNSRIHVVEEFNKGVYDIIIAADDQEVVGAAPADQAKPQAGAAAASDEDASEQEQEAPKPTKTAKTDQSSTATKKPKTSKEKDYGISRGIDFQDVACVLNFDLPTTARAYAHRIGRTGRAGKTGMALSFVVPPALFGKHKPTCFPTAKHDEKVLRRITRRQARVGAQVHPYVFDKPTVEAFRYRMADALRAVTRVAVHEARAREIRSELLASDRLRAHFEEHPGELKQLRHDGEIRAARVQPHLKHVPDYLMPTGVKASVGKGGPGGGVDGAGAGFVGFGKTRENRIRKARERNRGKGRKGGRKDPLKTFKR